MGAQVPKDLRACAGGEEGHDVSGADDRIEWISETATGQVEFGEITDEPLRAGMILLRGLDKDWVDIDPDYVVSRIGKVSADPAGSAAGIEDACATAHHGVHQTCFADDIVTGTFHGSETFDIPVGVLRVQTDVLHPDALLGHAGIIASWDRCLTQAVRVNLESMHSIGHSGLRLRSHGIFDVAAAENIQLEPFDAFDPVAYQRTAEPDLNTAATDKLVAWLVTQSKTRSGIWRDIAVRRYTEIPAEHKVLFEIARRHSIPMPMMESLPS